MHGSSTTSHRRNSRFLSNGLLFTSIGSLVFITAFVLLGGAMTPGYSHLAQFISELGASGARYEMLVRFLGFLPSGVMLLVFCVLAYASAPRTPTLVLGLLGLAIYALGYVFSAFFPCDPGCQPPNPSGAQQIHNLVGGFGYLLAPAFLLLLTLSVRKWSNSKVLLGCGFLLSLIALISLLTFSPTSVFLGFNQRSLELSVLLWIALFGNSLARRDAEL